MKRKTMLTIAVAAGAVAVLGGAAVFAQDKDKYSVKVPGGLSFSEFRGYEDWAIIATHRNGNFMNVIVGDPVVMDAFRGGIPGNGKPFPDGSKMAKIEWRPVKNTALSYEEPADLYHVEFMVKDGKRFADSGGWGYAVFAYDAASDSFAPGGLDHHPPQGNDAKCGAACHTIVQGKDYVFTDYATR